MPLLDHSESIEISLINIAREGRQRREVKTDGLRESIALRGLIEPIIVEREGLGYRLVAGERRLKSCIELGHSKIYARFLNSLDPIERQIIELEENIKRSDLAWQDLVSAVARIHDLYCTTDQDWTASLTAQNCALTAGTISMYLKVYPDLEDEHVAKAGTVREAYNILLRRQKRADGNVLEELLEASTPEALQAAKDLPAGEAAATDPQLFPSPETIEAIEDWQDGTVVSAPTTPTVPRPATQLTLPTFDLDPILNVSLLDWLPTYTGKKFNLIHCDFPYGVNLFSSNGVRTGANRSQMGRDAGEGYDDSASTYQQLVECLCLNLDKIMSVEAHIMFWFSNKWEIESWTRETFARLAPSISWSRFPLIWMKSDNVGIAASPNYEPRHVYETCLLGSRGKRNIVRIKADAYAAPTDKSIHQSAKPQPMLTHFMEMLVDEHTSLFDPTCGSGTSLRAAENLGASRVLGLEIDPRMTRLAMEALNVDRAKRRARGER